MKKFKVEEFSSDNLQLEEKNPIRMKKNALPMIIQAYQIIIPQILTIIVVVQAWNQKKM